MKRVIVWECKIVVPGDTEIPIGFDRFPRWAAMRAIKSEGTQVLGCFSGWGGELTMSEYEALFPDVFDKGEDK